MTKQPARRCAQAEQVSQYALRTLPEQEVAAVEAHLASCRECQGELAALRPVVDALVFWRTDVTRPSPSLWDRLANRIAAEDGTPPVKVATGRWTEPEWEQVAPGIACKFLATDDSRDRVSMLVRLDPGTEYPPHTHAGVEELHLLDGELWIDEKKLVAGDYHRGEPGTADRRVWSEPGCTCLLMTSPGDILTR